MVRLKPDATYARTVARTIGERPPFYALFQEELMRISHRLVVLPFMCATVWLTGANGHALAQEHHVVVPVDKVQWNPAPPILPPGAQLAVLEGNPGAKGPIVMRLKFPAN